MRTSVVTRRTLRGGALFVLMLLAIEFLDEFVFGLTEAAWPLIRADLQLSYEQIGLLMSLPRIVGNTVEPILGILGDVWQRRALILAGGVLFALALFLAAGSTGFIMLLLAYVLFNPSSGAFVSLSQTVLMDLDPKRHEHNMARWTLAGSLGVLFGSLALGAGVAVGLGWRAVFLFAGGIAAVLVVISFRMPFPTQPASGNGDADDPEREANTEPLTFWQGVVNAFRALRRFEVLRWLTLLQFSDLLLDVLLGYLALYFVDVVGVDMAQATLAVTVWTGVGLLGDALLIPLLERVRGLSYLRLSTALNLVLYPAFLLVPGFLPKVVILAFLGLFNAGWYSILQGQLYSAMPGQSGTVLTVGNIFGFAGALIPAAIGFAAERFGLDVAMWLLATAPVALLIGLPRAGKSDEGEG